LKNNFEDEIFDVIVAVSSIEHAGLGAYGESKFEKGDYKIISEFYRILKKKGKLIMTVPFGIKGETSTYRVYDCSSLRNILKKI